MNLQRTILKDVVYAWMLAHADDDGFLDMCARSLAVKLDKPSRTVHKALAKLEREGRICLLSKGNLNDSGGNMPRWVVVEKMQDE